MDDPKSGKIAHLHHKIMKALQWRATRPGDFERTSLCKQWYLDGFLNSCLVLPKNDFCVKMNDPKSGKIAPLHHKIMKTLRWRATCLGYFETKSWYLGQHGWPKIWENCTFAPQNNEDSTMERNVSWCFWNKNWYLGQNGWPKIWENRTFAPQNNEGSTVDSNMFWRL